MIEVIEGDKELKPLLSSFSYTMDKDVYIP